MGLGAVEITELRLQSQRDLVILEDAGIALDLVLEEGDLLALAGPVHFAALAANEGGLVGDRVDHRQHAAIDQAGQAAVGIEYLGRQAEGDVAIGVGRRQDEHAAEIGGEDGDAVGAVTDDRLARREDGDAVGNRVDGDRDDLFVVGGNQGHIELHRRRGIVAEMLVGGPVLEAACEIADDEVGVFAAAAFAAVDARGDVGLQRTGSPVDSSLQIEQRRLTVRHAVLQRGRVDRSFGRQRGQDRRSLASAEARALIGRDRGGQRAGSAARGGLDVLRRHAERDQKIRDVDDRAVAVGDLDRRSGECGVGEALQYHNAPIGQLDLDRAVNLALDRVSEIEAELDAFARLDDLDHALSAVRRDDQRLRRLCKLNAGGVSLRGRHTVIRSFGSVESRPGRIGHVVSPQHAQLCSGRCATDRVSDNFSLGCRQD